MISDRRTRVVVSVATTWELTLKVLAGRLTLPAPPAEHFAEHVDELGYELLPVHQRHVAALPELPAFHDDPFDRMLVAQALVEDLDLVSGDERIRRYPVRTVW
jgi:PIN domain nuclease of toxin-antitoxin system